ETARSLARFLLDYDPSAGSYRWVATAAEVARGEAAYRLRYELAVTGHVGFKKHGPLEGPVGPAGIDEPKARAMARSLLRHYLKLHRGERLTVETWTETLGYANAIALESLRLGARPLVLYQDEPTYWAATTEVPARNLAALGEHRRAALERTDAFVSFFGPSDRERFHALPPTTLFRLSAYEDALYQAAAKGRARAVQMAIGRVSAASARMYGVDEAAWREELVAAALVPPATLRRRAAPLVAALRRGRELTIRHPNGTELHLRLAGRTPVVSDGSVRRAEDARHWGLVTVPAGVVSVAVDERFAEGQFRSNQPSGVGLSDTVGEMRGAAWTFSDGQLRRARYDAGGDLFEQSRARAGGGRDRPASISIGLNEHLDRAPLLEDQALGTVTMHLGGNDYLGGRTPGPWVAWSFLRGATVEVDGAPIVRSGRLPR
ncbi:MAG TPA: hypothetical protein VGS23_09040, partial [Thermoplasmata archaeon]|nr:hypothetical protein [Thermoplasmata archaeon]